MHHASIGSGSIRSHNDEERAQENRKRNEEATMEQELGHAHVCVCVRLHATNAEAVLDSYFQFGGSTFVVL